MPQPSPGVFIGPLLGTIVVGVIVLLLAGWCAVAFIRARNATTRVYTRQYADLVRQARAADDALVSVINVIETSQATADTMFSQEVQRQIYEAHSSFREIGRQ